MNRIIKAGLLLVLTCIVFAIPTNSSAQLVNRNFSYADVAELVMPAVVNISSDRKVDMRQAHPMFDDPMFRRFFGEPEGGKDRIEKSLGSGVVISEDGYILTSNHVIDGATKIRVSFSDEVEYEAKIIGQDKKTDVALIKIDKSGLEYLKLGDSAALRIGDQVMAVGNPFGVGQTVTVGIVSALGRSIGLIDYEEFIQTDASINPGNSGGALVDMDGELVGINTAMLSRSGGSQGVGFAIPVNMASKIMGMLKEDGKVTRAWLGVSPQEISSAMADALGMEKPRGVMLASVTEDTPAEKAGLKEGDIILSADGKEMNSVSLLRNYISLCGVGHKAKLIIMRDGKEKKVTVTLGEFPDSLTENTQSENEDTLDSIEGVTVKVLTDNYRQQLKLEEDIEGLVVVEVAQDSNAAHQGLRKGDVITEVNQIRVNSFKTFKEAVSKNSNKPILLRILQNGRKSFLAIPR
jgi:serine protease Do